MPRISRPFARDEASSSTKLLVVACEGAVTEYNYFLAMARKARDLDERVAVKPLKRTEASRSAPQHVLEQLDDYRKAHGIEGDDELFMVVDRDHKSWDERQLAEVARLCRQKNYLLLVSNPCFEVWLLLHFDDPRGWVEQRRAQLRSATGIKEYLREVLGNTSIRKFDADTWWPAVPTAVERAAFIDEAPQERWPNELGTRVHHIFQRLMHLFDR